MYLDAIKSFPKADTKLQTEKGSAYHIKTDVFRKQMWYAYEGDSASGLIPMNPDRVREIMKMNQDGKKPRELNEYVAEVKIKEPDYENVVGQDSLNRFEHAFKKNNNNRKKKKPGNNKPVDAVKSGENPQQAKAANPNQAQNPQGNNRPKGSSENSNNPQQRNNRPNNRRRPNQNNSGNESPQ
jgi:hypothetical protein